MSINAAADALDDWAEKLESGLERQQSKGGDFITLSAEEVTKLVAALREASFDLNGFTNGSL